MSFKFVLGERLVIDVSGEEGTVIGRAEYMGAENNYLLRYRAVTGAVETWWAESALSTTGIAAATTG